jgi:AraC-like DNA-binding protein
MDDSPLFLFRYPDDQDFPFEIFRIQDNPFLTRKAQRPRRDTFYILFWITAGCGDYYIDFECYRIRPKTLFFISPGQVHYWESTESVSGYAMPFEEKLFHLYGTRTFFESLDLFEVIGSASTLYIPERNAETIDCIVDQIYAEYSGNQVGRKEAVVSLLQLLLIQAQRAITISGDFQSPRRAGEELTRNFLKLMEEQITTDYHLQTYAEQLGVTAGHLTEVVKEELGMPAGKLLRRRLVLEAKRWLVHTDLTVEQIAEKINFNTPSYFGRFFKREAGQTPRAFREEFQKKYQVNQE